MPSHSRCSQIAEALRERARSRSGARSGGLRGAGADGRSRRAPPTARSRRTSRSRPRPSRARIDGGHALEHEPVVGHEDEPARRTRRGCPRAPRASGCRGRWSARRGSSRSAGSQHQARDEDARLLAAREAPHRHLELLGPEEEALGPRRARARCRPWKMTASPSGASARRRLSAGIEAARAPARSARCAGRRRARSCPRRAPARRRARRAASSCRCRSGRCRPTRVPGRDDEVEAVDEPPAAERLGRRRAATSSRARPPLRRGELDAGRGRWRRASRARPARRSAAPPP